MKRKTEGARERKKGKCDWEIEAESEESGERTRSRKTDGRIAAFTSQSCLFAGKAATHFSSLSFSQSCHPLVISQHKILGISPGHRGCSQMLPNHRRSRQSLNKGLIKPQQCCMWMQRWLMSLVGNGNPLHMRFLWNFSPILWFLSGTWRDNLLLFAPSRSGKVWF